MSYVCLTITTKDIKLGIIRPYSFFPHVLCAVPVILCPLKTSLFISQQ